MAPKKGKKDKEQKDAAAVAPASVNLSPAMAELLNKKIREFEKSSAEENEKSQKAQKGKARTAAKNKLKEVKQIATGTAPDAEKIQQLVQRLEAEDEEAMSLGQDVESRTKELTDVEDKADSAQAELSKCLATKSKLESLLRQLQQQTNTLNEERRKLTDAERQRRQDLADEFQQTIADVKKKMDQQVHWNWTPRVSNGSTTMARLASEVGLLWKTRREKDLAEQQKTREVEVKAFEQRLTEAAKAYRIEAERERKAKMENEQLTQAEQALRQQLQTYGTKFSNFQDALSKSDKVLGQYKRQKGRMQRRTEVLQKENAELRVRNERKEAQVLKERDALIKEKADMQESDSQTRCRWTDCLNSLVGKSVIVKEHTNSSKTCISKQTITKTVDPTGPVSEPERQTLKYGTSLGLGTVLVHVFGLF
ncbi:Txlna [Symbiodinium microadriaticum]|nr:Txlna [Symbiodinium microadriaticum]